MNIPHCKARYWIIPGLGAAFLALAALVGATGAARAQTPGVTTYKDWTVNCLTQPQTGVTTCEMTQTIFVDATRSQSVLTVVVGFPQPGRDPGMMLVLPLGISLSSGVFLQIDEAEPQQVPVERCEAEGCLVQLFLPQDYLQALMAGSQGTVYAHDRGHQRFAVEFSLLGFTAGLNALTGN